MKTRIVGVALAAMLSLGAADAAVMPAAEPPSSACAAEKSTEMSCNLQYLQLQNRMQRKNAELAAVSNIMKTGHDAVEDSISNVR